MHYNVIFLDCSLYYCFSGLASTIYQSIVLPQFPYFSKGWFYFKWGHLQEFSLYR